MQCEYISYTAIYRHICIYTTFYSKTCSCVLPTVAQYTRIFLWHNCGIFNNSNTNVDAYFSTNPVILIVFNVHELYDSTRFISLKYKFTEITNNYLYFVLDNMCVYICSKNNPTTTHEKQDLSYGRKLVIAVTIGKILYLKAFLSTSSIFGVLRHHRSIFSPLLVTVPDIPGVYVWGLRHTRHQ